MTAVRFQISLRFHQQPQVECFVNRALRGLKANLVGSSLLGYHFHNYIVANHYISFSNQLAGDFLYWQRSVLATITHQAVQIEQGLRGYLISSSLVAKSEKAQLPIFWECLHLIRQLKSIICEYFGEQALFLIKMATFALVSLPVRVSSQPAKHHQEVLLILNTWEEALEIIIGHFHAGIFKAFSISQPGFLEYF